MLEQRTGQRGKVLKVQFLRNAKGKAINPPVCVSLGAAKVEGFPGGLVGATPKVCPVHQRDLARQKEQLASSHYHVTPIRPAPAQVRSGGLGIESPFMPPEEDALVWTALSAGLSNTKPGWLGRGFDSSTSVRNGLCLGARVGTLGPAASAAATEPVATKPAWCSVVRSQRLARRQPHAASKRCHQDGHHCNRASGAHESLSRQAGLSAEPIQRPQNQ